MNCQDIARILDSGKFGALSASQRRDGEGHARSCRNCATRWVVHERLADMPIPAIPPELAAQCQRLVVAHARGSFLRLVPRHTLILAGSFVVLAAAAAVGTVKYVVPALERAATPEPRHETVVAAAPVQGVPTSGAAAQPGNPNQSVAQGESDMNKPSSLAVVIAAVSATANAPAAAPSPAAGSSLEQILASNDLNRDGVVTREEATTADKTMIKMWNLYDMDSDGKVTLAEATVATQAMLTATAEEKITGEKSTGPAMARPQSIIESNDLDEDGVVTREEAMKVGKGLARLWANYDINRDGKVDVAEVAKAQGY